MAISATDLDPDWFDANFRQVLGIGGPADAGRPLAAPQVLAALGQRFTRVVQPGSRRVTYTRNGQALQLMDDPAEVDPLIATFAAIQLGGPRAALATIEADLCVPGGCEGDAGRALAAIQETLDTLIEVSARRDGSFRTRLLISQLIGTRPVAADSLVRESVDRESVDAFGLMLCLRRRLADGHRLSPSCARERALNILDIAIEAIRAFEGGIRTRFTGRRRPLQDVVETLHSCALHISLRVVELRRTMAALDIGQCELDRAGQDDQALPTLDGVAITIPDLFAALESQPGDWSRLIDGGTPDSQAAVAASVQALADVVDELQGDAFADLFNVGADAKQQLSETWARFGAYTSAVLRDLQRSLESPPASASAADGPSMGDALIDAPEEDQGPLQN
jgi:hypothetical protein